jgi:hypothetical protein
MALRAIWQFMDRDVTHKILYGSKQSWGPYTILWVTDRSINCHELFTAIWPSVPWTICYILTGQYFSILTGPDQYNVFFRILSELVFCRGSYGSIWIGPLTKFFYMDRTFWGPYNIFLVTDRSIYCHMTRTDMNYLQYYTLYLK